MKPLPSDSRKPFPSRQPRRLCWSFCNPVRAIKFWISATDRDGPARFCRISKAKRPHDFCARDRLWRHCVSLHGLLIRLDGTHAVSGFLAIFPICRQMSPIFLCILLFFNESISKASIFSYTANAFHNPQCLLPSCQAPSQSTAHPPLGRCYIYSSDLIFLRMIAAPAGGRQLFLNASCQPHEIDDIFIVKLGELFIMLPDSQEVLWHFQDNHLVYIGPDPFSCTCG